MSADVFGEVRSLLQQPPSSELWSQLCELLDEAATYEVLGAYLGDHLARWPDALREAPQAWCAQALEGEAPPWWPMVRAVRLIKPTNAMIKTLFKRVDVSHVTSLTLENERPTQGSGRSKSGLVKELTKAGPLPNLKRLELRIGNFGDKAAALLAGAKNLPGLEALELREVQFEDAGYLAIAASSTLPPLKSLVLHDAPSEQVQVAFVESPLCARLERLEFRWYLAPAALLALAQAPCAATLRALRVDAMMPGTPAEPALRAFVTSPIVEQLEVLDTWDGVFLEGDLGEALLRSPFPQNVTELHVTTADLSQEDLRRLFGTPMPRLRSLRFRQSELSLDVLGLLRDNAYLPTLEALYLHANAASAQDYVDVLGATRNLRALELTCTRDEHLTDDTLLRTFEAADLTHLRHLKLTSNVLEGPGLEALRHTPNLRSLDLAGTSLRDPGAMAALAAHAPEGLEVLDLTGPRDIEETRVTVRDLLTRVWPRLARLDLSQRATDADFNALMHAGASLPALASLGMDSSVLTDASFELQMYTYIEGTLFPPHALQKISVVYAERLTRAVLEAWGKQFRVDVVRT